MVAVLTGRVNAVRTLFQRNPLNLCYLCFLLFKLISEFRVIRGPPSPDETHLNTKKTAPVAGRRFQSFPARCQRE